MTASGVNYDSYHPNIERLQKAYAKLKKGAAFCAKETGNGSTVNAVAKFARRFFEFLAAFAPIAAFFGPAGAYLKGVTDLFKALAVFKSGQDLLSAKKVREIATSVLGIAIASLTAVKMFESFGWINLANITASFGKIAVIGAVAIVPLSIFISWLEAVKAAIDISLAVSNLVKTAKDVSHLRKKMDFWRDELTTDKCNLKIHKYRKEAKHLKKEVDYLATKHAEMDAKVKKWTKKDKKAISTKAAQLATQKKIVRVTAKIYNTIRPPKTTRKLRKWTKLNAKVKKALEDTQAAHTKVTDKKVTWQRIGKRYDAHIPQENKARYAEDLKSIEQMRVQKLLKTKAKLKNVRLEQIKQVASVFTNGATIVIVGGGTVMFFLGLFASPGGGVALTFILPALGLTVATVGLGLHFFKMYKGKKIEKVALPELSDAKTWKPKKKKSKKKAKSKAKKDIEQPLIKKKTKKKPSDKAAA